MIFKGHSGSILNMGMKILLKILKGRNKSVLLCALGNKEDTEVTGSIGVNGKSEW